MKGERLSIDRWRSGEARIVHHDDRFWSLRLSKMQKKNNVAGHDFEVMSMHFGDRTECVTLQYSIMIGCIYLSRSHAFEGYTKRKRSTKTGQ